MSVASTRHVSFRLITSLLLPLVCLAVGYSQPISSILAYQLQYHTPTQYDAPDGVRDDQFALLQQTVDLTIPVSLRIKGRESYAIGGLVYNNFRFDAIHSSDAVSSERYNRTLFKLGVKHTWKNPRHKTLLMALPTWAQQGSLFGDGFLMGGLGVHSYVINDRLTLKLGLYYHREFFGNFYMPLAGIDWRPGNGWYVFGLLPGTFNVYKKFNDWFGISLSERAPNGSLLANESAGDYVRYGRTAYFLLMLDLHFSPFQFDLLEENAELTFTLSAGHSVLRSYELYFSDHEQTLQIPFFEFGSGPYVKFTAWVRVWN